MFASGARVTDEWVMGAGTRYSLDRSSSSVVQRVPLDSLVGIEAFRGGTNPITSVLLSSLAVFAAVGGFKAAFGSCPTIYTERVALGARAPDVERMVLADGLRTILLGAGVGLLAALAVARMLGSLLYGVSTTDVPSFALVMLLLVLTASVATRLPARRAARVDPCEALRLR